MPPPSMSLFPPSAPKLPQFSSLFVTGPYHASAPIHLALSLKMENAETQPIILHPVRTNLKDGLKILNDAWLASHFGHGNMTELSSGVDIL